MTAFVRIVSLAGFVLMAWPVGAGAQSNVSSIKPDLVNEAAIRKVYAEFTAAWDRHDPEAMTSLWTIDGDHLDPDGRLVKGHEEIRHLLDTQHTTVFKESTLDLDINAVWFLTQDVALVDGAYALIGGHDPSGNDIGVRKGHLTSVLLREQEHWRIAASRLMIPAPLPWRKD